MPTSKKDLCKKYIFDLAIFTSLLLLDIVTYSPSTNFLDYYILSFSVINYALSTSCKHFLIYYEPQIKRRLLFKMSPLLFYVLNPLLTLHTILGTVYFCLSLESNLKKVGALPYIGVSMVAYVMVV